MSLGKKMNSSWNVAIYLWLSRCVDAKQGLVGGFNPSEKYWSNWIISPSRGENKKYLKPPPRGFYVSPIDRKSKKYLGQFSLSDVLAVAIIEWIAGGLFFLCTCFDHILGIFLVLDVGGRNEHRKASLASIYVTRFLNHQLRVEHVSLGIQSPNGTKYLAEVVIVHPNHHLTRWLDP